jgi:hypothetical protein
MQTKIVPIKPNFPQGEGGKSRVFIPVGKTAGLPKEHLKATRLFFMRVIYTGKG